jgi:hypothetical protein
MIDVQTSEREMLAREIDRKTTMSWETERELRQKD